MDSLHRSEEKCVYAFPTVVQGIWDSMSCLVALMQLEGLGSPIPTKTSGSVIQSWGRCVTLDSMGFHVSCICLSSVGQFGNLACLWSMWSLKFILSSHHFLISFTV